MACFFAMGMVAACSGDSSGFEPPGPGPLERVDASSPPPAPPRTFTPSGTCQSGRWATDAGATPTTYSAPYSGLDESCGPTLARRLCEIVNRNYRGQGYTSARQSVLNAIDVFDGGVQGIYDGQWFAPGSAEMNVEHAWPQSKGATGEAKSDMHHLFATRADYNTGRSNAAYGVVGTRNWPATLIGDSACLAANADPDSCYSVRGSDADMVEVFEPRAAKKGDVARAVFYFAVKYGQSCAVKSLAAFDDLHPLITEAILKRWNADDAPDALERTRNDRVERIQNVRNPFIDHPELAERISFQ